RVLYRKKLSAPANQARSPNTTPVSRSLCLLFICNYSAGGAGERQSVGVNLSGVPRGGSPLAGYKGCPLENLLSSFTPPSAAGEKKKGIWGLPKPRQSDHPAPPWGRATPLS